MRASYESSSLDAPDAPDAPGGGGPAATGGATPSATRSSGNSEARRSSFVGVVIKTAISPGVGPAPARSGGRRRDPPRLKDRPGLNKRYVRDEPRRQVGLLG